MGRQRKAVPSLERVRFPDEMLQQFEFGGHPVMWEDESEEALDTAVSAHDNRRGGYPTKSVAGPITCMRDFVKQTVAQRHAASRLIILGFGKRTAGPEREFDRTVGYIRQTLATLKVHHFTI